MRRLPWRGWFDVETGAPGPRHVDRRVHKQVFDSLVICGLSPLIIIALVGVVAIAAAIAITTGESILFVQDRVGLNGRIFRMWKFRTMVTHRPGGNVTLIDDERVTPLGRLLRKTHLDELPQLWNVLKGEMSLVGPRPEQPRLVLQYTRASPEFARRLAVPPGITGWAQVCGEYAGDHAETMIKLAHDLYYIENQTLALDAKILARTFVVMALRRGR